MNRQIVKLTIILTFVLFLFIGKTNTVFGGCKGTYMCNLRDIDGDCFPSGNIVPCSGDEDHCSTSANVCSLVCGAHSSDCWWSTPCDPTSWSACTESCGGGTKTNACGTTVECNTQPCCVPNCACKSTTCVGSTCPDGCGGTCAGTLTQTAGTWGSCVNCVRQCTLGTCGGACVGTAPSCAVNGTFSAWSPNNCSPLCGQTVTRTCSATCGGICPADAEGTITSKTCGVDEGLTNCSSTITTQYIETPQTTGTVWARATSCGSQVSNFQFPTWNNYNGQDDLVWYDAANQGSGTWQYNIPVASHQPLLGNPIIIDAYDWGCNHTTSSKKYIGGTSFTVVPKTCSVTINTPGAESTQTNGINVTVTGNAHINPGSDTVRVWITRNDLGVIPGGVTYDYGSSTGLDAVEYDFTGKYYSLSSAYQISENAANTSANFTVHVSGGNYRVHCDLSNDLDGNLVKCSGNPSCSVNGGAGACAGWKSCSDNDWQSFRINYMPELKPTPPAPTPTLPPPTPTPTLPPSTPTPTLPPSTPTPTLPPSTPTPTPTTMPVDNYLVLKNSDNIPVPYDIDTKNHTCQQIFAGSTNPRQIKFVVTATDEDGSGEITNIEVRLNTATTVDINGNVTGNWSLATTPVSCTTTPITKTCTFHMNLDNGLNGGMYNLEARATDSWGDTSGWIDSGRDLKIWDCQVPTSGTLYKAVDAVQNCPSNGFTVPIDLGVSFDSLIFYNDSNSVTMTVTKPADYGTNDIVWGKTYLPFINNGYPSEENGTLLATGRVTRIIDLGTGTTICPNASQFTIGNSTINPYSPSPRAQIDFSFIRDQEAWYQVLGAGVKGKVGVESGVPGTALQKALTWGVIGVNDNGLVSSNSFLANINGCNDNTCPWGNPNNWFLNQNTNDSVVYNYSYLYNNFYIKAGVGDTKDNSWGGWATNKIYFVSENLDIVDEDLTVPDGETMMVVVNGNINVDPSVKRLDGIYVADGNITVGGTSVDQLNINGMLYAHGDVRLYRGFSDKTDNNANPSVKVNYSPGLIFNLPPEIMRVLSGWREE